MALVAGLMGILLAFASMWVGWYIMAQYPELRDKNIKEYERRQAEVAKILAANK